MSKRASSSELILRRLNHTDRIDNSPTPYVLIVSLLSLSTGCAWALCRHIFPVQTHASRFSIAVLFFSPMILVSVLSCQCLHMPQNWSYLCICTYMSKLGSDYRANIRMKRLCLVKISTLSEWQRSILGFKNSDNDLQSIAPFGMKEKHRNFLRIQFLWEIFLPGHLEQMN